MSQTYFIFSPSTNMSQLNPITPVPALFPVDTYQLSIKQEQYLEVVYGKRSQLTRAEFQELANIVEMYIFHLDVVTSF